MKAMAIAHKLTAQKQSMKQKWSSINENRIQVFHWLIETGRIVNIAVKHLSEYVSFKGNYLADDQGIILGHESSWEPSGNGRILNGEKDGEDGVET